MPPGPPGRHILIKNCPRDPNIRQQIYVCVSYFSYISTPDRPPRRLILQEEVVHLRHGVQCGWVAGWPAKHNLTTSSRVGRPISGFHILATYWPVARHREAPIGKPSRKELHRDSSGIVPKRLIGTHLDFLFIRGHLEMCSIGNCSCEFVGLL